MKILFTGVSSFTGYHFVKKLSQRKNIIIYCTLQKKINSYKETRRKRLNLLLKKKNINFFEKCKFGNIKFCKVLKDNNFDILCLHHSHTNNYNDDKKFNIDKSKKKDLYNCKAVFENLKKKSLVVVSNTIFQNIKSKNYKHVNKYGLSKTIFYNKIKKLCKFKKIRFKSVYITNPWGLYEEKKLNYNLIKTWINQKSFIMEYPKYIRDNIYIDKLSMFYNKIIFDNSKTVDYFPSGYCSSNEVFIEAFRKKFEHYFGIKAYVKYLYNTKHTQPLKRINGTKVYKKFKIKENLNNYFKYYKKIIKKN